jgi:DeoR/GlpR family transcriptional regulator of sugar metabolism
MLAVERKRQILEVIGKDGRVVASELTQRFGVSEDTIRRDLRELAAEGLLHRVHGGALPLPKAPISEAYTDRAEQSTEAKTAIGRAAAALIHDGQVVTIDGGTTPLEVAHHLGPELRATVVTHSVPVLRALAHHKGIELISVGGRIMPQSLVAVGPAAVEAFRRTRADVCIVGVAGVDVEAGLTALNYEESLIKQAMAENASQVIAVATADKLGTAGPFVVVPTNRLTHIVTERTVPESILKRFQDANVHVILA